MLLQGFISEETKVEKINSDWVALKSHLCTPSPSWYCQWKPSRQGILLCTRSLDSPRRNLTNIGRKLLFAWQDAYIWCLVRQRWWQFEMWLTKWKKMMLKILTEVCGEETGKDGDNHRDQVGREAACAHQNLKFTFNWNQPFSAIFGATGHWT